MKKTLIALSLVALFGIGGVAWASVAIQASPEASTISTAEISSEVCSLVKPQPTGIPVLDGTTSQLQYCIPEVERCILECEAGGGGGCSFFCISLHCS